MEIIPLTTTKFAAEVHAFDADSFDEDAFQALYVAWLDYGVLRLRQQTFTDDGLMRFSQRFGALEYSPMGRISKAEMEELSNPYVLTISNIRVNGKAIGGLGAGETSWHTDMSYVKHPPKASLLYALKVPPAGGQTHFCCMEAALAALPKSLRKRVSGLRIKHDAAHDSIGKLRRGHQHSQTPKDAPGEIHSAIRLHPETQRPNLFLGRRADAYIEGLDVEQSEELLDEIWQYVATPSQIWTQEWNVGDLMIWDNRRLMHKRSAFSDDDERLMRRTQVKSLLDEETQ